MFELRYVNNFYIFLGILNFFNYRISDYLFNGSLDSNLQINLKTNGLPYFGISSQTKLFWNLCIPLLIS